MQKPLFSGTCSFSQLKLTNNNGERVYDLARKWTTHPGEALEYAFLTTKRLLLTAPRLFSINEFPIAPGMVVFAMEEWRPENFEKYSIEKQLAYNRGEPTEWYQRTQTGGEEVYSPDSVEQKSIKLFSANSLDDFIKLYVHEEYRERETRFLELYRKTLLRLTPPGLLSVS